MEIRIRPMEADDWEQVIRIFLEGVATGEATFETASPSRNTWDLGHLPFARLVAISPDNNRLKGWAALSPISGRSVYAGVAEVSIYVADDSRGKGIGRALLEQLIAESEQKGIWTLQASVFPENHPSIALHQCCGFREVGIRERIGCLNGVWRDTVLLERRSKLVKFEAEGPI